MKTIIFVCHGSICRSPAAEYIMKSLTSKYNIYSRALSYEEIGNDIYPLMKYALRNNNIDFDKHISTYLTSDDVNNADYIFYMDNSNKNIIEARFSDTSKFKIISLFTPSISNINDPWYTGEYELVINQLTICIKDILKNIN